MKKTSDLSSLGHNKNFDVSHAQFSGEKNFALFLKGCIFHPNQGVQLENFSLNFSNFAF